MEAESSSLMSTGGWVGTFALCVVVVVSLQVVFGVTRQSKKKGPTKNNRRSKWEWNRRAQHASTGLLLWGVSFWISGRIAAMMLGGGAFLVYGIHRWRLVSANGRVVFDKLFGALLRESEREGNAPPGALYFLLGMATVFLLFDPEESSHVARLALLSLSLADPMAGLVGTACAGYYPWNISLVGNHASVAGCAACWIITWILSRHHLAFEQCALEIATITTLAEAISKPILGLDDNFLLPIATASAAHFLCSTS